MTAVTPTYNFKIKRSGPMGTQFTVKKRIDPKLAEAERKLNEKSLEISTKKKTNKKSKK